MGRTERIYTTPFHWNCSNGTRNAASRGYRGCKDSECTQKHRKELTNRARRNYSKIVIREALND